MRGVHRTWFHSQRCYGLYVCLLQEELWPEEIQYPGHQQLPEAQIEEARVLHMQVKKETTALLHAFTRARAHSYILSVSLKGDALAITPENNQTDQKNAQTRKQASKRASKQANKQTNK